MALSVATLKRQDAVTSAAVVDAFSAHEVFVALAATETDAILRRDAEDAEKLTAGIAMSVAKGVLPADPPVEPTTRIDVLGQPRRESNRATSLPSSLILLLPSLCLLHPLR